MLCSLRSSLAVFRRALGGAGAGVAGRWVRLLAGLGSRGGCFAMQLSAERLRRDGGMACGWIWRPVAPASGTVWGETGYVFREFNSPSVCLCAAEDFESEG